MECALRPGDVIIVKKKSIAVFSKHNVKIGNQTDDDKCISFIGRIKERDIKRNDIIVFRSTIEESAIVKRCIGMPGETIYIDSSKVYINGIYNRNPESVLDGYVLDERTFAEIKYFIDSCKVKYHRDDFNYILFICTPTFKTINSLIYPIKLTKYADIKSDGAGNSCYSKNNDWTIDFFGPVIIPRKKLEIQMDTANYELYRHTISTLEGKSISRHYNKVLINNSYVEDYVFTKNYYFVLGDYRYNSKDSRYIGFIPEENIIGTVQRVLFSYNNHKFDWSRLLHAI